MTAQLTIQHAIAERLAQEGMDRALEHAEAKKPGWGELAYDWLLRYAKAHERFAGYMVVKSASLDPNFPRPPNDKAWGGVIKKAVRAGVLVADGMTKDPHRHCNPIRVWRSLIFGKETKC